jgi:hypothetical protein
MAAHFKASLALGYSFELVTVEFIQPNKGPATGNQTPREGDQVNRTVSDIRMIPINRTVVLPLIAIITLPAISMDQVAENWTTGTSRLRIMSPL